MSLVRAARLAAALLALAGAGCGHTLVGDNDERPYWRRPGGLEPPTERIRVPDDGFYDHLAAWRAKAPGDAG